MKLATASLCMDCDEIHDSFVCPSCGSQHAWPIARWLDRETRQAADRGEVADLREYRMRQGRAR